MHWRTWRWVAVLCYAGVAVRAAALPPAAQALLQRAGNADDDADRLALLGELRDVTGLDAATRAEIEAMVKVVERWLTHPKLAYFGGEVKNLDVDLKIAAESPIAPLTWLYRGRMVLAVCLENGNIWGSTTRRQQSFDAARGFFERYAKAFPENRIARMYLGEPIPWTKSYPVVEGAPAWAATQRDSLEGLADIIAWWIDHRQRENGDYGGGWGDDCEMWRWWTPVLIGFESDKIRAAQAKFSRAIMGQSHMQQGYTTQMSDVEHTAEDSADAITPMMHLDPDNPEWQARARRLAELMQTRWTGRNERGFLQFKSTYFTAEQVDPDPRRACDTVYHPRTVQPALLLWQRTRDPQLTALFSAWMDTWVDATARAEHGKPAGIVEVSDPIKPTAAEAIKALHEQGLVIIMATGDNERTARAIAQELGIDRVEAGLLPEAKAALIERLQAKGAVVAMAGDGINDAPALSTADVGIAMGTGADVALESAGITLLKGDLTGIVRARKLAQATIGNIRQNLAFAFLYNTLGVPVAAGVLYPVTGTLLSPMLAAAAMSFSSVSVIANALRLRALKL